MRRRVSSPELIGRAAELAALDAALATARTGRGRLVLVEGEAGIGKTRLVEQFTGQASDVRVLSGGGIPLAGDTPYAPMIEVFRALDTGLAGVDDPFGRTRLLGAVADALAQAATRTPVVLVVEDLHWADPSTCGLVSFLGRAIRSQAVLLIVTIRTGELDPAHPVSGLAGELAGLPHALRLAPPPLAVDQVAEQVRAITGVRPAVGLVAALARRAAGNPFYVEELLAAGADAAVPVSLGEVVLGRVARLPEPAQRVVRAAAVLGRAVPHPLLAAVTAPADLESGLPVVVRHRLLEAAGDGYEFRHPLIQESVYADLLPPRRQALHARAAQALEVMVPSESPADRAVHAVQVAFHWRAAAAADQAVAAAIRAGDLAVAAHAPAEALAQYTHALEGGAGDAGLLARAAEAASAAGYNDRAAALIRQALKQTGPDPAARAVRLERLGRFSWLAGDLAGSQAAYEQALRAVPDEPSAARARVLAAMAQSLMLRSRYLASRRYAEQAREVARAVGARSEQAHAGITLGTDLAALGHHGDGIAIIQEAGRIAAELGDVAEVCRCHANGTEQLVKARRAEEALSTGEQGVRAATAHGLGRVHAPNILADVLAALHLLGRWDELESRAQAMLDTDPEPWSMVYVRLPRCRIALARGNSDAAATDLAVMTEVPGAAQDAQYGPAFAELRAGLAALRGDLRSACEHARDALALTCETDDLGAILAAAALAVRMEADALEADRAAGRRTDPAASRIRAEELQATARTARDRIVSSGGLLSPPFELLEALARAHLSRLPGPADPDLWQRLAEHPLADPYLRGQSLLHLATALLARRRDRHRAARALAEAAELARPLGATPLATAADALARRARLVPAPPTETPLVAMPPADMPAKAPPADPDRIHLTPRERQVIALLRTGLSNAQIANTLYISEKTASVHVSNILRKLGVTSRLQAAAYEDPQQERT